MAGFLGLDFDALAGRLAGDFGTPQQPWSNGLGGGPGWQNGLGPAQPWSNGLGALGGWQNGLGTATGGWLNGLAGGAGDWLNGLGTGARDPFAGLQEAIARKAQDAFARQPGVATTGQPLTETGAAYAGPATADDNRALTGQAIDAWIARTRPGAPLAGLGQYILDTANQYGVSAPLMLGIFLKESELGTTAGDGKILSGITDPSRDQGLGGQRAFQGYATWQDAIAATARLLASDTYRGKSLGDQVSLWYVGKPGAWNTTDQAGNGTVAQYVAQVAQVYQALGVPVNTAQPGTPRGGAAVNASGYAFPVVGYHGEIALHHGQSADAADIMAPAGTGIVAMRGGTVVDASYNALGGNTVTIRGDDGLLYYYAHMQGPALVRAGQQIRAGTALGAVGNTGNAANTPSHLHLGIGKDIQSGDGPEGGAGIPWGPGPDQNAVGLLRAILAAAH